MEYDEYEFEFESKYQDDLEVLADLENEVTNCSVNAGAQLSGSSATISSVKVPKSDAFSAAIVSPTSGGHYDEFTESALAAANSQRSQQPPWSDHPHSPSKLEKDDAPPSSKRTRHLSDVDTEVVAFDLDLTTTRHQTKKVKVEESRVLRRIPAGAYVSSTTYDGVRLYMRLLPDNQSCNQKLFSESLNKTHQLLPQSYRVMYQKILDEREQQLLKDIAAANSKPHPLVKEVNQYDQSSDETALWVEKFKPSNYLDLLSDDGTNRALLRWLKLWDKVVFNREVKQVKPQFGHEPGFIAKGDKGRGGHPVGKTNFEPNKFQRKTALTEIITDLDCLNCPRQKIALLCGPPGLGKTTLAHVIAAHAGYNVVELNASDDRSPEAFRTQIESATQMRSVLGRDPRPNCLIIDEIDGAPLASINLLLNVISNKAHDEGKKVAKKKRRDEFGPLLRPIICICNDQYVPALRPLRGKALILTFPPTLSIRLASRLMEVSHCQNLKTDMSALLSLCTKADNDIRSCLSTLQFVHRKRSTLRMTDVNSLSVGQKDIQKSLFSVWQEVFQIPRNTSHNTAKKVKDSSQLSSFDKFGLHLMEDNTALSSRFYKVLSLVQSYGEYSKINRGLFENFLTLHYKEYGLQLTSLGCDWLSFSDILEQEILHLQNYSLMAYQPFTAVAFHLLFAVHSYPKLIYPSSQFELKTKVTKSQNIVNGLIGETSAVLRPYINLSNLVMDTLPLLVKIIQPQLRPVNTQLFNTQEKADLMHCIQVMILFNLTFQQQCNPEGQFSYSLNPEIDLVGCFYAGNTGREMTYASKQMVAREIDLEKMRRSDTKKETNTNISPANTASVEEKEKIKIKPLLPNHQQTLKPKILEKKIAKQTVDFFGRIITKSAAASSTAHSKEPTSQLGGGDIWFRFKEGYSNAVRKNVRIADLL